MDGVRVRVTGGPLAGTNWIQTGRAGSFLILAQEGARDDTTDVRVHERLCEIVTPPPAPPAPRITPEYGNAVAQVLGECVRQIKLKDEGRFTFTCADPEMTHPERLAVLVEEVGEVARAILEGADRSNLRTELIQAAAVCVSWVVAIDRGDA